jgi:hypothetical protein
METLAWDIVIGMAAPKELAMMCIYMGLSYCQTKKHRKFINYKIVYLIVNKRARKKFVC